MNAMQVIAELGGPGAIANLVAGVFSAAFNGWREALMLRHKLDREDWLLEEASAEKKRKWHSESDHAKTIVRLIVFTAFLVISAPVWAPLMTVGMHFFYTIYGHADLAPSLGVTWYYAKEGSFWVWEWSRLQEFTLGPKDPDYEIGVLPIFFAISTNIVAFYLLNRVRKKLY